MLVSYLLLLGLLAGLPLMLTVGRRLVVRAWRRYEAARDLRRAAGRPQGPPIERISADLHRIVITMQEIERANPPMKAARLRAAWLAYDDVLITACRALEVTAPAHPPLQPVARLQAEAELARHGFDW